MISVSIRSRLFGREKPDADDRLADGQLVSIRSRLFGREKQCASAFWCGLDQFQSAPGFSAGRNPVFIAARVSRLGVSIRSRLFGREKPLDHGLDRAILEVSIRSRLFGREKRCGTATKIFRTLFQSAPGFSAGRNAAGRVFLRRARPVSIRSRLFGREKLTRKLLIGRCSFRFQSAPGFSAGRNLGAPTDLMSALGFNPLPAFRPGETFRRGFPRQLISVFQSAPGFSAGRNCRHQTFCERCKVSIRSRLFGREKRDRAGKGSVRLEVSIRSRLFGREKQRLRGYSSTSSMFQSAPGFSAGRNADFGGPDLAGFHVSIRSRLFGREKRD